MCLSTTKVFYSALWLFLVVNMDKIQKKEMESQLKYNVEDKNKKRYAGKGFEANNCPKQDNLINNLLFFIDFVVSIKN